jgi:hypothetical protein
LTRKILLALATLALALCAAQVAKADASYTDPAGDSGAAPDITAVTAANDAAGNLTFTVRTNQAALAADAQIEIPFDLDQNTNTGGHGVEAFFVIWSGGWEFLKWNGTDYVNANAASANGSYANGVATFKVNKADLGGVERFTWWADALQFDANEKVIATDTAPDGDRAYGYALTKPLTLRAGKLASLPARPAAGKAFAVGTAIVRGDTGGPLTSGTVRCTVRIGTAPLRAAGIVSRGVAACSMRLPKTAKGKLLRVTMKVTFQGVSTTKTYRGRVV